MCILQSPGEYGISSSNEELHIIRYLQMNSRHCHVNKKILDIPVVFYIMILILFDNYCSVYLILLPQFVNNRVLLVLYKLVALFTSHGITQNKL